ncbi:capsid protein [Paenibacillus odorifer]|uniref:capsid protein n=1 Tax=Paenibacillus odorifer TaxID=189426 RepID=UPI00096EE309|nr:capsid protein [Paenibacillus odorifer]OME23409.1 capsid protein [Paenibacillus odorifer]
MGLWTGVRNMVMRMLQIRPAQENKVVTITEPFSYRTSVMRNRLWYRGDPSELDQFYKQTASDAVSRSRFWAAVPSEGLGIRKFHSGLPAMVADRLSDIVIADMDAVKLQTQTETDTWDEISKDNDFPELLGNSITEALITGDGAFKITADTDVTKYPIVEFYSGEQVDYVVKRGRLQAIIFNTEYQVRERVYRLEETFSRGKIEFKLLDANGKEVPLTTLPETAGLQEVTFKGNFIMAVSLKIFKSQKWSNRGKSIFDSKSDSYDALDEVISQWMDAIRAGRVQKYIPDDLVPRDPNTGMHIKPNPFDNQYIKLNTGLMEDSKGQVSMVQPQILYEAFVSSYASTLDMCLQGIISPSTLGIDLKKTDNAEAQREKEKATLYTRGKIVDRLNEIIPELVIAVMKTYDIFFLMKATPGEYEPSVSFGEYASPSFDAVVETVGKARTYQIMSIERAVEEMYGDTWTDEEKAEEVARLKEEQGLLEVDEPSTNRDKPPDDPEDEDEGE